jgi:hypothetical protein
MASICFRPAAHRAQGGCLKPVRIAFVAEIFNPSASFNLPRAATFLALAIGYCGGAARYIVLIYPTLPASRNRTHHQFW